MADENPVLPFNPYAQAATIQSATSADQKPNDAARAIELSKDTGVPATVIHQDLPDFESKLKGSIGSHIIRANPIIQDYIHHHPLAAAVSNDDWGQLDAASEEMKKWKGPSWFLDIDTSKFKEGFEKYYGTSLLGTWPYNLPGAQEHPNIALAIGKFLQYPELGLRTMAGLTGGIAEDTKDVLKNLGFSEQVQKMPEQIAEATFDPGLAASLPHVPFPPAEAIILGLKALPYLRAGKRIPFGVDPHIDKGIIAETKRDAQTFNKIEQAINATQTSSRSPPMQEAFNKFNFGEAKIGLSLEKLQELYGEDRPAPGDNKLGDIPDIGPSWNAATGLGSDIEVPIASYLAHVPKEFRQELKESIRYRPEGLTLEEANAIKPEALEDAIAAARGEPFPGEEPRPMAAEPIAADPVDSVRKAAGLGSMEKKLSLLSKGEPVKGEYGLRGFAGKEIHDFHLIDENGRVAGDLSIIPSEDGKHLHVDMVNVAPHLVESAAEAENYFGPRLMRDLLRQLKAEFPKMEDISGYRASGVRGKRAEGRYGYGGGSELEYVTVKADDPQAEGFLGEQIGEGTNRAYWLSYDPEFQIEALQPEVWSKAQQAIIDRVNPIIQRMAPRWADIVPAAAGKEGEGIRFKAEKGRVISKGLYFAPGDGKLALIMYSLNPKDALPIARHEVFHHMMKYFLLPAERSYLLATAAQEKWLSKWGIRKNEVYRELGLKGQLEEAVAFEFQHFRDKPEIYGDTRLGEIFWKMHQFFTSIKEAVGEGYRNVFGKDPTYTDLFRQIERGEIGARRGMKEDLTTVPKFAGPKQPIKAGGMGWTEAMYKRWQRLKDQLDAEDAERQFNLAQKRERKEQTEEWKRTAAGMRDRVEEEVKKLRPVQAAAFIREKGFAFREDRLNDFHKESLPKSWLKKDGYDPDAVASAFGYNTGEEMLNDLAVMEQTRGNLSPKDFLKRLVDHEVQRQMEAEHGILEQNIINAAQDHVLSPTQMDLLHEETLARGLQAGVQLTLTKNDIRAMVRMAFEEGPWKTATKDKYLAQSGRADRKLQEAMLKQDWQEVFKHQQEKHFALLAAREAAKFEKVQAKFNTLAKKYSKREVPGAAVEYTNFIHEILMKVGMPVKRDLADLQREKAETGFPTTLLPFLEAKEGKAFGMLEIPVADFLLDEKFNKSIGDMTVDEYKGLAQSITALDKRAREEERYLAKGRETDRKGLLEKLKAAVERFPLKRYPATKGFLRRASDFPRAYLANGTSFETFANRWDLNDPRGVWNSWVIRPLTQAASYKDKLIRKYAKLYQALGKIEDPGKLLDSPFNDPLTKSEENPEGLPWTRFTRLNALAIIQNMGNEVNLDKLARGYGTTAEKIQAWVRDQAAKGNITKADFDRAQGLGNIFGRIFKEAEVIYRNIYGVPPERIALKPIDTPFGQYEGWYHPLVRDPIRRGLTDTKHSVWDEDYGHAYIANSYTKRRTGAIYPLDLNLDVVPARMAQMIHDIAFRETVIEVEKLFRDKDLLNTITAHYGEFYSDGLMPYLRGIAGAEGLNSRAFSMAAKASEFLRQNVISEYIGFNPYTALKHGPTAAFLSVKQAGAVPFWNAFRDLYLQGKDITEANHKFVDQTFEEVNRRVRHWQDTIVGTHRDIFSKGTLRERIIQAGSWMVAQSDMISTKATALAAYREALREGQNEGQAIYEGERAVRRAHGSTAITNLPALVGRAGPLHGWLTTLFGFFGTMLQRRIEVGHMMADAYRLGKTGDLNAAAAKIPEILSGVMYYYVIPTAIEELVTGLTTEDKHGWGYHLIAGAGAGLASSFLYIRDIYHGLRTGQPTGVGLLSSPLHDVDRLRADLAKGKKSFTKAQAAKTVGDTLTVFGEATGMFPKVPAKATQFGIDLALGRAHPRTPMEVVRGVTRGTTKRFQEK